MGTVVRGAAVVVSALFGLGFVSAVAYARRPPIAPAAADPPLEIAAGDHLPSVWGPAVELAIGERGIPFLTLPPLRIVNLNTRKASVVRLYDAFGRVDEVAAAALDELLSDARDPDSVRIKELDRRVFQLVYRAAYHFRSKSVQVISAYREPGARSEGRHGFGRALDFRLANVSASALAAYLRTLPRVGVGVYTNPNTQYVHLDDRDRSYHWLDASPPGRKWRERPIGGPRMASRDAAYLPEVDWPEGTSPSPLALANAPNAPDAPEGNL